MRSSMYVAIGVSALLALSIACGRQSATPLSPSSSNAVSSEETAGADGTTLKVSKPTLVSPVNDFVIDGIRATVIAEAVTSPVPVPLAYDFEMYDASDVKVRTEIVSGTTWVVPSLDYEKRYTWRVRATASYVAADGKTVQSYGPWSDTGSFVTPANRGYIRGNELYDPLFNGATIGQIHGPTHFIPGVGLSLDSLGSYVSYQLQQPLTEGEFSILATNVRTRHEGDKTKIMAMSEGYDDITTNNRRMTLEKRANGLIAWRLITHGDQIDTIGAERQFVQFNLRDIFFFQMQWRANRFDITIKQDGENGRVIYNMAKHFAGRRE